MVKKDLRISYMAAVYLRLSKEDTDIVSTSDKLESNSIANQKALILKELESMPDVTLYDIYIDDGYTGLNFDRPEFRRMQNDIYDGKVNMVIVKDLSRLGRDYIESGRYIKKIFPSLNVRFVSILDHFDSLNASQSDMNLMLPVKNFVNDSYSRDISAKVRSHLAVMRENGLFVGAYVAYGYKKAEDDSRRIVPDEYSAGIVKRIFAWKLEGMSAEGIANKLNKLEIVPPSEYKRSMGLNYKTGFQKYSKAKWSAVAVGRILRNKIYIGVLEQGKTKKVNYKLNKSILKPESEWTVLENAHEPIISKTDFENVARLLRADIRRSPSKETAYLFSGLIFCGECGKSMIRRTSQRKDGTGACYICSTHNRGKGCSRHSIQETVLESIVLDAVQCHIGQIEQVEYLLELISTMEIRCDDIVANDQEILQKYEEQKQCREMENSLHKDLLDGIISKEEYVQFSQIYAEREKAAEQAIASLRTEVENVFLRGLKKSEWMENFIKNKNIEKLDRNIVVSLIEKIIIHEGARVEIIFTYADEYQAALKIIDNLPEDRGKGVWNIGQDSKQIFAPGKE